MQEMILTLVIFVSFKRGQLNFGFLELRHLNFGLHFVCEKIII